MIGRDNQSFLMVLPPRGESWAACGEIFYRYLIGQDIIFSQSILSSWWQGLAQARLEISPPALIITRSCRGSCVWTENGTPRFNRSDCSRCWPCTSAEPVFARHNQSNLWCVEWMPLVLCASVLFAKIWALPRFDEEKQSRVSHDFRRLELQAVKGAINALMHVLQSVYIRIFNGVRKRKPGNNITKYLEIVRLIFICKMMIQTCTKLKIATKGFEPRAARYPHKKLFSNM